MFFWLHTVSLHPVVRGEQLFACRRVRLAARGEVGLALKRLKRGASEWVEPPVVGALVTEVAQPLLDAAHSRDRIERSDQQLERLAFVI